MTGALPAGGPPGPPAGPGREPADEVAAAVLAVPGVVELHPGAFGEVATYLPGRRVTGVRLRADGSAEVHLVLAMGEPVLRAADAVRLALTGLVPGPVHVSVQDVVETPTGDRSVEGRV